MAQQMQQQQLFAEQNTLSSAMRREFLKEAKIETARKEKTRSTRDGERMKAVKGALSGKIAVPAKLMPELVVMSMSHNGWSGTYNQLNEIVARKRKNAKAAGVGYEVDYAARIWWEAQSDAATKVVVEVTDREGNVLERDCKQESANLIAGIDNRAANLPRR